MLMGIGVWALFYPGLFSTDGLDQYAQAVTREFTSWHSPLMTGIMSLAVRLTGGVGGLALATALGGTFGIRFLTLELLAFCESSANGFSAESRQVHRQDRIAAWVVFVLMLPLFTIPFAFVTFIKDYWLAILWLWAVGYAARLWRILPTKRASCGWMALVSLSVLIGVSLMLRHDAVATLPVFCAITAVLALRIPVGAQIGGRCFRAGAGGALPVVAWMLVVLFVNHALSVRQRYPEYDLIAVDLVGMCVLEESLVRELPFMQQSLWASYKEDYRFGADTYNTVSHMPDLRDAARAGIRVPGLVATYREAALQHPFLLVKVKLLSFLRYLNPFETDRPFRLWRIQENRMGLESPGISHLPRYMAGALAYASFRTQPLHLFHAHLTWLIVNIVILGTVLIRGRRNAKDRPRQIYLSLLFALPLSYTLSKFLVLAGTDYRYMFPSTLLVQVTVATWLAGRLVKLRGNAIAA